MRRPSLMVLALLVLALSPAWAAPQPAHPFLDFDFEASECTSGWFLGGQSFEWALDSSALHSGRQSLRLEYVGRGPWNPDLLAASARYLPAAGLAGKHIRLTGWIRTEDVNVPASEESGAGLWWRADGEGDRELAIANSEAGLGTTPWTRYTLEMDVPAETKTIAFGVYLAGSGRAWFDSLALEAGGKPWAEGKPPSTAQPTGPAVAWLRKKAIPFRTPEAGNGFDDLQPLRKVVGDARIVSLGEDTHGTREFFQMKHRLVEFLASEMGFTLFAIEANMPEAYKMNDYVLTGRGDPRELLKGMYFWTWNTQEVLDMVEWMRAFNQSGRGRIQFLGFDMQYPGVAAGIVSSFVAKADPDYTREASQNLSQAQTAVDALHHGRDNGQLGPVEAGARSVYEHLAGRRDAYLARFPREDVDWAIQNARVVLQSVQYFTGTTYRDESMANNVEWILDQSPGEKIVLWAHNLHVGKQDERMGSYLAERYGRDMVVLGFAFGQGQYNAVGLNGPLGPQVASPPMPGSVESYLAAPHLPRFIVDLRGIPGSAPSASWLTKERLFRNIGAVEDRCGFHPDVAAGEFDGLIWFDQTSPSALLPF